MNDPPYGTERADNALRVATSLLKRQGEGLDVFLMSDPTPCARSGQTLPQGYYSLERMPKTVGSTGGDSGGCGACMDARALKDEDLLDLPYRSTMDDPTNWTVWTETVPAF